MYSTAGEALMASANRARWLVWFCLCYYCDMPSEHMPKPELLPVPEAEAADVARQLDFAEGIIEKSKVHYEGETGDYFLFYKEELTPPGAETPIVLGRPDYELDEFMLIAPDGNQSVGLDASGRALSQSSPRVRYFRDHAKAIEDGTALGAHSSTAVKFIDRETDTSPVSVEVTVTRTVNDPGEQPITTAELRFTRHNGYDDSMLVQSRHIEFDPNAGTMKVGDSLEGLQWDASHLAPGEEGEAVLVPDPMPQVTADVAQDRYQPPTPVNRELNSAEWQQLLLGNLYTQDMLQPHRPL
jgi:hypothetical protein